MQKTSARTLAGKYDNFQSPAVKVFAAGRELALQEGMYLDRTEVTASVKREPDMAVLVYRVNRLFSEAVRWLEERLALGQKMEIKAGYGAEVSRIFLGYLHEVSVSDPMRDYVEYTLICLDAKGLMKRNSVFQISGEKKLQQILNDVLNAKGYAGLVEKKEIAALPASLNQDCVIKGETHYDWLCSLAERLDYEFFCGRGKLVFRKAQEAGGEMLELTEEYGLRAVRATVSMTGQTGSIRVNAYTRRDEKLSAVEQWPGIPGPFGQKLKQTLQELSLSFWDMDLETGEQARLRAEKAMRRAVRQCSRMEAVNIGLPELAPGICIRLADDRAESLSGSIYVEEVEHLLDERGYETVVKGIRQ